MRIVQILPTLDFGGQERLALDLALQQKMGGDQPYLYCTNQAGPLAKEAEDAGIPVRVFGKGDGISLKLICQIAASLRRDRTDVLHAHNPPVLPYAVAASRLAPVGALVHTRHGRPRQDSDEGTWKLLCRRTDRVILVSNALRSHYIATRSLSSENTQVIYNGINLGRFLPRPARPNGHSPRFRFGTLGRLSPQKDQVTLVRAFASVAAVWPEAELYIMGDGPCRAAIAETAVSLGIANRIRFQPAAVDVGGLLANLDLFVLSSTSEGFPIVLQEAMAAGLPIVSTRLPGFTELLPEGEVAWFCRPGHAEELARLMLEVARRPDLATAGQTARRLSLRFGIEETWRQYRRVYEEVLTKGGRRPAAAG
jgi:glycosyltransferase involved in cell wall biosynthesis